MKHHCAPMSEKGLQNVSHFFRRVIKSDERASSNHIRIPRGLWKGEHVSKNGGILNENALVDLELDILGLQDDVSVVVPEV